MNDRSPTLLPLVEEARGRCHSCANQRRYDLPAGTRSWCRAFGVELSQEERDEVRSCPRWAPFRPEDHRPVPRALQNPLLAGVLQSEDRLFYQLKCHLDDRGLDLKTLMVASHPSIQSVADLAWIDTLDERFSSDHDKPLADILIALRALNYDSLCDMVERSVLRIKGPAADAA